VQAAGRGQSRGFGPLLPVGRQKRQPSRPPQQLQRTEIAYKDVGYALFFGQSTAAKCMKTNQELDFEVLNDRKSTLKESVDALKDFKKMTRAMYTKSQDQDEENLKDTSARGKRKMINFRVAVRAQLRRNWHHIQKWEKSLNRRKIKSINAGLDSKKSPEAKLALALKFEKNFLSNLEILSKKYGTTKDRVIREKVHFEKEIFFERSDVVESREAKFMEAEKTKFKNLVSLLFDKVEKKYAGLVEKSEWDISDDAYKDLSKLVKSLQALLDRVESKSRLRRLLDNLEFFLDHAQDPKIDIESGKPERLTVQTLAEWKTNLDKKTKLVSDMAKRNNETYFVISKRSSGKDLLLARKIRNRKNTKLLSTRHQIRDSIKELHTTEIRLKRDALKREKNDEGQLLGAIKLSGRLIKLKTEYRRVKFRREILKETLDKVDKKMFGQPQEIGKKWVEKEITDVKKLMSPLFTRIQDKYKNMLRDWAQVGSLDNIEALDRFITQLEKVRKNGS